MLLLYDSASKDVLFYYTKFSSSFFKFFFKYCLLGRKTERRNLHQGFSFLVKDTMAEQMLTATGALIPVGCPLFRNYIILQPPTTKKKRKKT